MGHRLTLVVLASSLLIAGNVEAGAGLCPQAATAMEALAARANAAPRFLVSGETSYPSVITGALSAPRSGTPVELAERFVAENDGLFAAAPDDLRAQRGTPNAIGRTVRFQQLYEGVPVVGAELAVVVRRDGSIRIASSSLTPLTGIDVEPVLAAQDAIDVARGSAAQPIAVVEDVYNRLVIVPVAGTGVLAWEIQLGAIPGLLSNLWAYVDAQTGALVRMENRIAFDYLGQAFETNPGEYGGPYVDPVEVTLAVPEGGYEYDGGLSSESACDYAEGAADCLCPGDGCVWLSAPLFLSRNCPDYHQTTPLDLSSLGLGEIEAHFCSEVQTASADATDEFMYAWEGSHYGLDDLNGTDKFSEVQMFHHVTRIYDYFLTLMDDHPDAATLDWDGHEVVPLMATVNFRIPINMSGGTIDFVNLVDPEGELYPFDNAFFMPGGPTGIPGWERPFDSIVFGQGTMIDFSWDGDVIYHEFTHSVANSVSVGVGQMVEFGDEWGVNVEPGGMSEGYADAFAGFFTNEPRMGEYSFGGFAQPYRDMMGDDLCPGYLQGEVHADSLAWSQSLYQAREAAADDDGSRHKFEQAAFVGLSSVVENQGFAEAALATAAAIEELLGGSAREAAEAVFAAHHTDDCPRVIGDDGTGEVARETSIAAPAAVNGAPAVPYVPGIVQYMVTAGEGDQAVNLAMDVAAESSTGGLTTPAEPAMLVLVSAGAPLQFEYDGTEVTAAAGALGPYALDAENRFSLVGVTPGEYYVMPVNEGEGRGILSYLAVSAGDPVADEEGTVAYDAPGVDAGGDTDTDADAGPIPDGGAEAKTDDGCGCSATGRGAAGTLLGWIAASLFR
jgi:hypothetical protein